LKIGLGIGLLVCVLVPIALLLFGVVGDPQAVALLLFLAGLWTAVFGVAFAGAKDRLYDAGFGVVVMLLSTFLFLPLQYTAGLVVLAIIAVIAASVVLKPKGTPTTAPAHPPATMADRQSQK
jgi:hypothetical protein